MIGAVLLVAIVLGATLSYKRLDDFINATTGHHINPLGEVVQAVEPQPGTIAYKLQHGQQVNILLLGMGGYENDAPFLTDSIMAVTIDPNSHRVMLASIPRDLVVRMNLQNNPGSIWTNKINAAYEVPLHEHHLLRRLPVPGSRRRRARGGARGRQGDRPDLRPLHRC